MITDPPRPPPPAYVSALQPPTAASLAGSSSGGGASASGGVYAASTIITGGDGEGEVDGARQWPPPLEPLLPVRAGCWLGGEGQASRHDTATQEGPAAEAQTAAGTLPPEPRCLQDVCARVILRNISVHNCCELLALARGVEGAAFAPIAAACLRYAVNSFETLVGLRDAATLRACLGPDVHDSLAAALEERRSCLASIKAGLGRVRERQAPPAEAAAPRQETSVAGRPVCYPLAALAPGLTWPPDVDGGCREQWLGADDWAAAFGPIAGACGGGGGGSGGVLSYQEFVALPAWRRNKLKQAAGLF